MRLTKNARNVVEGRIEWNRKRAAASCGGLFASVHSHEKVVDNFRLCFVTGFVESCRYVLYWQTGTA